MNTETIMLSNGKRVGFYRLNDSRDDERGNIIKALHEARIVMENFEIKIQYSNDPFIIKQYRDLEDIYYDLRDKSMLF